MPEEKNPTTTPKKAAGSEKPAAASPAPSEKKVEEIRPNLGQKTEANPIELVEHFFERFHRSVIK